MKKLLIATMVVLIAAVAVAQEVTSVNLVGFTKKVVDTGSRVLVSAPFDIIDGTKTLESVLGTDQLAPHSNYLFADRVIMYDIAAGQYQSYAIYDGDLQYYPCNNITEWNTSSPTNPPIPEGIGFWLVSGTTDTNEIALMGEVVSVETQTIDIVEGYQLIGYPFSSKIAIKDTDFENDGATAHSNYLFADRIVVWEGDYYQAYALYDGDSNWYPCNNIDEWNTAVAETERVLELGEGAWYISQSVSTWQWSETNKYLSNL
jgi:hypothetical protein